MFLEMDNDADTYEVDLLRCLDEHDVLDWIAQVTGKRWADAEVLAGLLHALNDLLHIQGKILGSPRRTPEAVRELVRENLQFHLIDFPHLAAKFRDAD